MQLPSLSTLRSSKHVQRQVDHTMADLESKQCSEGNSNVSKIKSKRRETCQCHCPKESSLAP